VRRLIINADDFGLTSGVNRAIAEANLSGVLTSATIMANSRAYEEAVATARKLPALKTGCHVVLIDGEPVSAGLASLTNGGPRFESNLKKFAMSAVGKKISEEEIERETEAQIRKLQASGLTVTHVDSHKHTHMFPHVVLPVLRAARACGIRAVRNPFEPRRSWAMGKVLANRGLWMRAAEVIMLQIFAARFRKAVQEENMLTTDGTVGITATGLLDEELLHAIINALPEGTWELVCHPGYSDADLQAAGTRLLRSREVELQALTSAETRSLISRRGIELISYADLQ
jgi:hopanoid biosynthesis associated protein HpnK